jgi:hypothetical protein
MVVIRIKNDGSTQFPLNVSDRYNIKVLSDLKLCKILENDYDEKIEKKIEFVTSDNTNNINNIYGIYNIIKNEQNFFEHDRWNKSGYHLDTNQLINSNKHISSAQKHNGYYEPEHNRNSESEYNNRHSKSEHNYEPKNKNSYGSYNKAERKYYDRNTKIKTIKN